MAFDALIKKSLADCLDACLDHKFCFYCPSKSLDDASDSEATQRCILLQNKQRIQRLHEDTRFLLNFVGDLADKVLEARVTAVAIQAQNLFWGIPTLRDHQLFSGELEKSILETESIREEAMRIKNSTKVPMPLRLAGGGDGTVVGMEEDLLEIKSRLCGGSSELGIIPIVGMGGIGKTALASSAYDNPFSAHHFDRRVWVSISQTYDLVEILCSVMHSLNNVFSYVEEMEFRRSCRGGEALKEEVYRELIGRRYLIVMDDMWDTDLWDEVRRMFPDDGIGSRIIITTRDLNVASYIGSLSHPHQMRLMSVDQSWRLLKKRVFVQENCPSELEKIGQVIAERCRGLPLAVVVIAGVLSRKVDQMKDSWEKIASNVSKVVSTNDEQIIQILSLSYDYLPSHLRPFFLYMGCFPEDYEINVSKLIRLWAAEGFLESNESKDMEELGYEYLEDLVTKSLVLIYKKGSDGRITSVKIHDLLRDLCITKCRDENFLCTINDFSGSFPHGIENSNRLSVFCNVSGCPNMESSPTQTILLFKNWALDSLKSFRLLKVFDGLSVTLRSSSSVMYICELIHLTYLALTCEPDPETLDLVSENLHNLHNLQTLVFRIFRTLFEFHSAIPMHQDFLILEIWRMPQLRHLILLDGFLPQPSAEIWQSMENLHTLYRMKDFECSDRFLEMIPNLKKLGIVYSWRSMYETGWSQYGLNNLVRLCRLEKLSLSARVDPNMKDGDLSQHIAFPISLTKLSLRGCRFPWKDMSMIGLLPNLQVLKLKMSACYGDEWETNEGEFCQLKVLLIDSCEDLLQWITESSHFPKLERLTLYQCGNLREIPNDIGEIATLELIEVDIRNSAMVESAKCIEEEQQSFGNDLLQVRFLKSRSWAYFT